MSVAKFGLPPRIEQERGRGINFKLIEIYPILLEDRNFHYEAKRNRK
jgi:hypothetical protein